MFVVQTETQKNDTIKNSVKVRQNYCASKCIIWLKNK